MGANISDRPEVREVLDAIRRIVHGLRESSRRAEREVGLSGAQLFVLQALADRPSISVNELAALTHTHQSSVSVVVSRLVDRGFVRRVAAKADRRRMVLSLTAKGQRVAGTSPDVPQDRLVRGIAGLPAARRRQLAASLTQLAAEMRGDRRPEVMFFEERTARKKERRHV